MYLCKFQDLAEESQSKTELIHQLQNSRKDVDLFKNKTNTLSDVENKLFVMERNVRNMEDRNTDMENRFDKELQARNALELKNKELLRELEEARAEIKRLEGEIRPIG